MKEIVKIQTSWSDEQLDKLCVASNHRITYNGYEYWWEHKINGNLWETHYIEGFEDYTVLVGWLRYWLGLYIKEANQRKEKYEKIALRDIKENLKISETYISIEKRRDISLKEKLELMDRSYKIKDIDMVSKILKKSHTIIRKHLKELQAI